MNQKQNKKIKPEELKKLKNEQKQNINAEVYNNSSKRACKIKKITINSAASFFSNHVKSRAIYVPWAFGGKKYYLDSLKKQDKKQDYGDNEAFLDKYYLKPRINSEKEIEKETYQWFLFYNPNPFNIDGTILRKFVRWRLSPKEKDLMKNEGSTFFDEALKHSYNEQLSKAKEYLVTKRIYTRKKQKIEYNTWPASIIVRAIRN